MGVWGTAIFSDDNAADIRDDYRALLGDGVSGPEATDRLIKQWQPSWEHDPDMAAVFWLALAVTQWKSGRLEDRARQEAMQAIDSGTALRPWKGGSDERKRAAVLEKTRKLLNEPQPPARKISKVFRATCAWEPGQLIGYQLLSGSYIVFQVVELHTDKGGTGPVCEIYDWQGALLPSVQMFANCPMRGRVPQEWEKKRTIPARPPQYRLMILQASKREFPSTRLFPLQGRLDVQHPPKPKKTPNPTLVCLWRKLDKTLEMHYGLR